MRTPAGAVTTSTARTEVTATEPRRLGMRGMFLRTRPFRQSRFWAHRFRHSWRHHHLASQDHPRPTSRGVNQTSLVKRSKMRTVALGLGLLLLAASRPAAAASYTIT